MNPANDTGATRFVEVVIPFGSWSDDALSFDVSTRPIDHAIFPGDDLPRKVMSAASNPDR